MGSRTPLYTEHLDLGARIVPFGGWDMPLHYGSQLDEHHHVRRAAGVFDVSHMRPVDIEGAGAREYLRHLLANDVARLITPGKALYSCMLNERGGVVDDLIVYWRGGERYRLVVNAATAESDIAWMRAHLNGFDAQLNPREDLAMLAVQGPEARERVAALLPETLGRAALALKPFFATEDGEWFIARTGYTGEDGFELMLPAAEVVAFWRALLAAGVHPCGLGARDTLRLEAGMNLYGQDMDADVGPLESGLGWTLAWEPVERDFIGRTALEHLRGNPEQRRFIGLLLDGRGVLRAHQRLLVKGQPAGEITSGGFAPTLGRSIAFARLDAGVTLEPGEHCAVEIRGQAIDAHVVKPPFARQGQACIALD